jgi:hypothetical protein
MLRASLVSRAASSTAGLTPDASPAPANRDLVSDLSIWLTSEHSPFDTGKATFPRSPRRQPHLVCYEAVSGSFAALPMRLWPAVSILPGQSPSSFVNSNALADGQHGEDMSGTHSEYLDQQLLFALLERITVAIEKIAEQSIPKPERERVKVNKESVAIAFVAKSRITDHVVIAEYVGVSTRTLRRWESLKQLIASIASDGRAQRPRSGFRTDSGDVEGRYFDDSES